MNDSAAGAIIGSVFFIVLGAIIITYIICHYKNQQYEQEEDADD
jgi:hypothetical protein